MPQQSIDIAVVDSIETTTPSEERTALLFCLRAMVSLQTDVDDLEKKLAALEDSIRISNPGMLRPADVMP